MSSALAGVLFCGAPLYIMFLVGGAWLCALNRERNPVAFGLAAAALVTAIIAFLIRPWTPWYIEFLSGGAGLWGERAVMLQGFVQSLFEAVPVWLFLLALAKSSPAAARTVAQVPSRARSIKWLPARLLHSTPGWLLGGAVVALAMALLFIWAITASFEIYGIGPWIGATPYLLFLVGGIWWCLRDRRHQAAHALAAAALTVALLSSIAALWIAGFRGPIAWIDGIGSIGWFSIVTTPFNAVSFCLMLRAVFWANPSRDEAARPSGAPASPASHRQTAGLLTGAIACGLVGSFTAFSLHIGGLVAFALLTNRAMTDRSGLREWFLNWALFPLPAVLATGALAGAVIAARVVASRHSNSSG